MKNKLILTALGFASTATIFGIISTERYFINSNFLSIAVCFGIMSVFTLVSSKMWKD